MFRRGDRVRTKPASKSDRGASGRPTRLVRERVRPCTPSSNRFFGSSERTRRNSVRQPTEDHKARSTSGWYKCKSQPCSPRPPRRGGAARCRWTGKGRPRSLAQRVPGARSDRRGRAGAPSTSRARSGGHQPAVDPRGLPQKSDRLPVRPRPDGRRRRIARVASVWSASAPRH